MNENASQKNKDEFIKIRRKSLQEIGNIEALLLPEKYPYNIPSEFDNLPRLVGRASVNIETSKGKMYFLFYKREIQKDQLLDI